MWWRRTDGFGTLLPGVRANEHSRWVLGAVWALDTLAPGHLGTFLYLRSGVMASASGIGARKKKAFTTETRRHGEEREREHEQEHEHESDSTP